MSEGFDDEPIYELLLTSDSGRTIDTLEPTEDDPMYEVLSEIFSLAEGYIHDSGINKALEYLTDA